MISPTVIDLRIPAKSEFSDLAAYVAADAAARAELPAEQTQQLAEAVKLGFELVVRDAMADAREPLHVRAVWTPEDVRIALIERGLPLDGAAAARDPGWAQIVELVEGTQWKLHSSGSELLLTVKRPHGIAHSGDAPPAQHSMPLAPPQQYTVRRFQPQDAPGVARAFYQTWGYHYIVPAVYVPQRLIDLNASEAYISIVAVAQDGEIVGHFALDPLPGTPLVDGCAAIVNPAHRGRGLLERMREFAEHEAMRLGFGAFYTEPVTTHPRTQEDSVKIGAKLCAIVLGGDPAKFTPKAMQFSGAGQRQSFTIYIKPFATREKRTIYPPVIHRTMIETLYGNLGFPIDVQGGEAASAPGELHIEVNRSEGFATVTVARAGSATAERIAQVLEDIRTLRHVGAVYVNLPLEDPGTPALFESIALLGFFFCGVVPWAMGGHDALRLQVPLTPIDLSQVTIFGEFGAQLKAYIAQDAQRWGR
jgi:hypothetical protein